MYFQLNRFGHLNVDMDKQAKQYWQEIALQDWHHGIPQSASSPIYQERWQLWQGDTKITQPNSDTLYDIIQDPITQSWWVRHGHSTYDAQELIDWDATKIHMHHLPQKRRQWVTKNASRNCGIGTILQGWGKQDHAKCVRCSCLEETVEHCICLLYTSDAADE